MKKALVISGGGSKGAFAGGVSQYLLNKEHKEYDLFIGTSTGSLMISNLALGKLDDLKLNLALEANKFNKYTKLSPSGKSPRQKYIGCNLNELDPITQKKLSDLPLKKIKYLSKITSTLDDGKKITHCYDTIPLYNYILDCYNKGSVPFNLALGSVSLTEDQLKEVYKKIRYFN